MQKAEIKKVDENAIVRQSNELIEANYKLTTAEQKVILNFIAQIDTTKESFEVARIGAKSLSDACGFNPKSGYRQLQQVLKKLLNRSIILQRRNGSGWYGSHWVQSCDYVSVEDGDGDCSYVEYELDKRLCPHFLQLRERFLKSNLKSLVSFSHVYSTRFYMIFKNRVKIGNIRYSFKELCKLLELPKSYNKSTINIKNKIIKVAVEEINEKSDITVEYSYYKDGGRAHVGVDFTFYHKAKDTVKPISEHPVKRRRLSDEEQAMYDRLTNPERWNISDDVARKAIKKHSLEMLDANLRYAWKYKKGKENLGGWLISCIKKDSAGEEAERKAQRKAEEQRQHAKAQEAADIAAAGMFPEQGAAAEKVAERYAADKEKEIKAEDKLPDFLASMIIKAGSADKVSGIAKNEMEKRGLTYEAVLAGER